VRIPQLLLAHSGGATFYTFLPVSQTPDSSVGESGSFQGKDGASLKEENCECISCRKDTPGGGPGEKWSKEWVLGVSVGGREDTAVPRKQGVVVSLMRE